MFGVGRLDLAVTTVTSVMRSACGGGGSSLGFFNGDRLLSKTTVVSVPRLQLVSLGNARLKFETLSGASLLSQVSSSRSMYRSGQKMYYLLLLRTPTYYAPDTRV